MLETLKFKFWAWLARTLAEDSKTCERKWDVVCGILSDVAIQVQCVKCGTWGVGARSIARRVDCML